MKERERMRMRGRGRIREGKKSSDRKFYREKKRNIKLKTEKAKV